MCSVTTSIPKPTGDARRPSVRNSCSIRGLPCAGCWKRTGRGSSIPSGYTLCANGENTFYTKNTEYQKSLHRGYVGFESDSQNFLYTLHYVLRELKWPLKYFKHVITPLPFAEAERRGDRKVLSLIRESLAHLEINGPNTIIAVLPDGSMMTCCDSKKLRPVVVGGDGTTMAISSEVCGLNAVLPDRDASRDIYPNEREVVLINNDLAVQRWNQ